MGMRCHGSQAQSHGLEALQMAIEDSHWVRDASFGETVGLAQALGVGSIPVNVHSSRTYFPCCSLSAAARELTGVVDYGACLLNLLSRCAMNR